MRHGTALAAAVALLIIALWGALIYITVFEPAERATALLAEEYGWTNQRVAADHRLTWLLSTGYWLAGVLVTAIAFVVAYIRDRAGGSMTSRGGRAP